MPGMSGLEFLKWIRTTPRFATLPVLILSSSNQLSDIESALLRGANSYLVKPGSFEELTVLAKAIKDFWLDLSCNRSSTCVQKERIAETEVCAR
jgi:CheY-like chemotaxis protein